MQHEIKKVHKLLLLLLLLQSQTRPGQRFPSQTQNHKRLNLCRSKCVLRGNQNINIIFSIDKNIPTVHSSSLVLLVLVFLSKLKL